MVPYLAPVCTLEPLVDACLSGLIKINWLTVIAVVLVTVGTTLRTDPTPPVP
jgi:hypothetical protein